MLAEQNAGNIRGLSLPDSVEYLVSSYSDDTHLVLSAETSNLQAAKHLMDAFSAASGLTINWKKSDARWLAQHSRPPETTALNWSWKSANDPGTLLGFSFSSGLSPETMFKDLLARIEQKLQKWSNFPLTISGKVIVANHLILLSLWYVLTLNCTNPVQLRKIQRLVVQFVWSAMSRRGRHRVAEEIICLPKAKGGLGLLEVQAQAQALGGRILHWLIQPGDHPLQPMGQRSSTEAV